MLEYTKIKRFLDFIFALILLIILLPLFIVLIVIIRIESRGPAFYKQQRVGMRGKIFKIYKFRSMVVNSDKLGSLSTASNDPRITAVGKMLRKTSIDELPQLINIILGQMSFIGPRPDVEKYLELFSNEHLEKRLSVRPGITGFSQISGRSSISLEERIVCDEQYVDKISLKFDVYILFMTIKKIIIRDGVN